MSALSSGTSGFSDSSTATFSVPSADENVAVNEDVPAQADTTTSVTLETTLTDDESSSSQMIEYLEKKINSVENEIQQIQQEIGDLEK